MSTVPLDRDPVLYYMSPTSQAGINKLFRRVMVAGRQDHIDEDVGDRAVNGAYSNTKHEMLVYRETARFAPRSTGNAQRETDACKSRLTGPL